MTISTLVRRAFVIQAVVLVLGTAVVAAAFVRYRAIEVDQHAVAESRVAIEELRSAVLSAETAVRGFALVESEPFLQPYHDAFPVIDRALGALRSQFGPADPRVVDLAATIEGWRDRFAEPVLADLAAGRRRAAADRIGTTQGKVHTDRVRELADVLLRRAEREQARLGRAEDLAGAALVGGTAIGAAALAGTAIATRRGLDRRLSEPMAALAATAAQLGRGDLSARATEAGTVEVVRAARAFNDMAERLEATVDELRSLDRMKSELMSVVSHELRTPLTSIRGSLGLVTAGLYGDLSPDAHEMLAIATSNTDRLVRLINDLLDLERMESGRSPLDLRPCSVGEVVDEALAGAVGAARTAGVELRRTGVDGHVVADPDRLVQALTNLIGNALKFSPTGGTVVVDVARPDDGAEVAIRVVDQGRGIPADRLGAIFERFEQVDASDARDKGGTGLGLPIARRIVEQHEGRLTVDSTVGRGSTFTVWLPATEATGAGAPATRGAERWCIAVIEDDRELAQVLSAALTRHGLRVALATGASEAVEVSRRVVPDLLVLDVGLDEGDGYEVVAQLRRDDRLHDVPVVVFTGRALDDGDRARLRLGPTEFLEKGRSDVATVEQRVLLAVGAAVA